MIRGHVTAARQAVIVVHVRTPSGTTMDRRAVVDTGFTGFLTLPPALVATLQLPYVETRTYRIGNNQMINFDLYEATVEWDGQDRLILVLASDAGPLVGMSLLNGYRLYVDVVDGGDVVIEVRP